MTPDAKFVPHLPDWMVEHTNSYLAGGGTDEYLYRMTQPGRPEPVVPSLLLTATGRNSGEQFISRCSTANPAPAAISPSRFQGRGGAPRHRNWYRYLVANPDVEYKSRQRRWCARSAPAASGRAQLWEKALQRWPPDADYQRKTERETPIVVLDSVQ
jgi:deazaflavin-dependent oxidoreductase (nitroreductase family)